MARYIDADVLKRNIRVNLMPNVDVDGTVTVENAERYFLNLIDKTSTADVVEVVHAHWIENFGLVYQNKVFFGFRCTACNLTNNAMSNYCPNCGAKMDGGV